MHSKQPRLASAGCINTINLRGDGKPAFVSVFDSITLFLTLSSTLADAFFAIHPEDFLRSCYTVCSSLPPPRPFSLQPLPFSGSSLRFCFVSGSPFAEDRTYFKNIKVYARYLNGVSVLCYVPVSSSSCFLLSHHCLLLIADSSEIVLARDRSSRETSENFGIVGQQKAAEAVRLITTDNRAWQRAN